MIIISLSEYFSTYFPGIGYIMSVLAACPSQVDGKLSSQTRGLMFSHQYLQLQPVWVVSDLLSIFTCNSILLPPLACDGPMWRNPHTPLGQLSAAPAQVDTQWMFVEWMSGWRKEKWGWKGGKIIILYGCWHCCFRSPWLINSIMTSMQQFKEMLTLSMYWYEEISRILNVKSKVTLVCALDCFCEKKEEKNKTICLCFKLQRWLKLYLCLTVVWTTGFTQKAAVKDEVVGKPISVHL